MNILTNKDIKRLFFLISGISILFICILQLITLLLYSSFNVAFLLLSILFAACILGICILYFQKQNQIMNNAISQINHFISGDTNARIECDSEGGLYKLFHAVNTLSTTLASQSVREQKMKVFLKDTISDISHQLKTPLAALNIYNSILQDESEDKVTVKEFAAKSEKEIDRIETLVQNLLKITKLDAGTIIMDMHMENVADMMDDIRRQFETRADMENKTITLTGANDIELFCDRCWMLETISNLVKNALDHTKVGDYISIEWNRLPTVTQITINDSGSGIHQEDIHHIFKRFYRSRLSKDTQGIGLGLSLTKAIVEAHDGNITVDSVLGNGSAFILNFINLTEL